MQLDLVLVSWLLIILRDPLADFSSRHSDNGIIGGVVVRLLAEDLHAQRTFL